jgi:hypothetical protein
MHEDEETEPTEEQEQEMEEDDDASHLDFEGDREVQAYNHIKNRDFFHTLAYDPDLLTKNRYEHRIHHHQESRRMGERCPH